MARQKLQKCTACGAYGLATTCGKCGQRAQAAGPLKWSPEDRQAQRRRQLHDVGSEEWMAKIPEYSEEE
ncbi:MAG: nucleolar RNA-binding Nop10p family protein [Candidatus Poseidoniaceae archaeon]|jgi:rRNA maturation protein Nop10|nr:nucleolar RNA-binding Nop10p family protein [Candidatus Poseidoniaceae archaeon]MDP7001447.1 nucleolar RNA-binding Nop10p family protein [Candidatus Poseidoniaceae archaeon]